LKKILEKILPLNNFDYPETLAVRIESEAEKMYTDGWFFTHSSTDELMENIVLFFERET
jgi:regulator of sirC expression with transglutaminase-like and TPR domain